ncbi:MAG: SIS domain-containing protein [Candidatus Rokubacteria bacterium]|nr:SIS domain-containing protein [Candidatus Rokubacteria bacterium]
MDVSAYVRGSGQALQRIDVGAVERVIQVLERARAAGHRIFIFGNGGSGATASHFAQDLAKGTVSRFDVADNRFRVMSLTDNVPHILALANDLGYETIFKQQMMNHAGPGDVAIGISGSGNSPNVLEAIQYARSIGMVTIGLTGFDGGKLRGLVEHSVHVPSDVMEHVEDAHMVICHATVKWFQAARGGDRMAAAAREAGHA